MVFHTGCAPKATRAGHVASMGGGSGSVHWHVAISPFYPQGHDSRNKRNN
ncbi:hypothetical protein JL2886_01837 [Phaeobacter gallaeciensis]|uniref:Uncharacterized protein n=1 Tax=Phaeobacter gallaeciensis TaxID=60890 RepID=A0A1B0ZRE7_9RHOB|nr:hypothetical protein JL2886_01837 [Phaeobacter gallaeciensis]